MSDVSNDLIQKYFDYLPHCMNEEGLRAPLMARRHNGEIIMAALLMQPDEVYHWAMMNIMPDVTIKEIIFGIDRYTKPGQGTKYADALTIYWWVGERVEQHGWRFGVVNYRPPPNQIIEPIDWNNAWWNATMWSVIQADHQRREQRLREFAKTPEGAAAFMAARQKVLAAREAAGGPLATEDNELPPWFMPH